jgi:DNA polymerase III subunit delta
MASHHANHFNKLIQPGAKFPALCVITGNEILLLIEAHDQLRASARDAGFTERTRLVLDSRSDWSQLSTASGSGSLFGDKQLIDIALPTGKPGKTGGDALFALANRCAGKPAEDVLTFLQLPKLETATKESKWAKAIFNAATVIEVADINRSHLPSWVGERLSQQKQTAQPESLQWLADKVEGNLLAAHQEILKLGLLYPEGELTLAHVQDAVLDVARYNVFGLRDAMLSGQTNRMIKILEGLRSEGEALPLVLWAVGEEIRTLARIAQAQQSGQDRLSAMKSMRIFGQRETLVKQALDRVPAKLWPLAVAHAHEVDRLIKGISVPGKLDNAWDEMARLMMRVGVSRAG